MKKIEKNENQTDDNNLDFFNETFSILSHEVNNPISSIKLASELIKKNYNMVDKELINIIQIRSLTNQSIIF